MLVHSHNRNLETLPVEVHYLPKTKYESSKFLAHYYPPQTVLFLLFPLPYYLWLKVDHEEVPLALHHQDDYHRNDHAHHNLHDLIRGMLEAEDSRDMTQAL